MSTTFAIPYISLPTEDARNRLYEAVIELDSIARLPTDVIWLIVDGLVAALDTEPAQ